MPEKRYFNIVLWSVENFYCPPVTKTFNLPVDVDPSLILWARVTIDLNPIYPSLGYGCVPEPSVTINGKTLKGIGDRCDVFIVEIPSPNLLLKKTGNIISFDVTSLWTCFFGHAQGTISGILEGEALQTAPPPIPTATPTATPVAPPPQVPEGVKPCKVFGMYIGDMTERECQQAQTLTTLMLVGVGVLLVLSVLRR